MNIVSKDLPLICQHDVIYRLLANYLGKILHLAIMAFYSVTKRKRSPRTRVLVVWGDYILLVRNVADFDRWTLSGGGVKKSETYPQAIARELYEELNIKESPDNFKLIKQFKSYEVAESYDKVCFLLSLDQYFDGNIKASLEILETKWFKTDNLPDNLSIVARKSLVHFELKTASS